MVIKMVSILLTILHMYLGLPVLWWNYIDLLLYFGNLIFHFKKYGEVGKLDSCQGNVHLVV